jgi:hypothetical protein
MVMTGVLSKAAKMIANLTGAVATGQRRQHGREQDLSYTLHQQRRLVASGSDQDNDQSITLHGRFEQKLAGQVINRD